MEITSKFTTNFSPRNYSAKEFIDLVTKNIPRNDIFLIPITNKLGYWTTPFPQRNTKDRWCWSENGTKVIFIDQTLIFEPMNSFGYVYTRDGKSYKFLDEHRIMEILKKRPELAQKNKFRSHSEPLILTGLDNI